MDVSIVVGEPPASPGVHGTLRVEFQTGDGRLSQALDALAPLVENLLTERGLTEGRLTIHVEADCPERGLGTVCVTFLIGDGYLAEALLSVAPAVEGLLVSHDLTRGQLLIHVDSVEPIGGA